MTAAYRFAFLAALASSAACTVHGDKTPPLAGPSEFALSVSVTATPDSIPQDGASQASIAVTARDADGKGIGSLRVRIDMALGDSVQDYGILSARTVTTGTDGRATAIYTAPPPPASLAGGTGTVVSFNVTPIGSNYQTAHTVSAAINLVPPGVVLPEAGTPRAVFAVTPTPLLAGVAANFDASRSCPTAAPCGSTAGITSFAWTFGDGTSGTGQNTTHTYAASSSHQVTLTVTNDRGATGFSSQTVGVTASALPTADFVFSPSAPQIVGGTPAVVNFNAGLSKAGAGRTLAQFSWDFGDGTGTQQGSSVSHSYGTAGVFAAVLTVTDDVGQTASKSATVPVTGGTTTPPQVAVADFVYTPAAPVAGADVSFNAAASHAAPGRTLTQYIWDFGDGGGNAPGTSFMVHRYAAAGTYSVVLTIVDDAGQRTQSAVKTVTVTSVVVVPPVPPVPPTAEFVFSPTDPNVATVISFNAETSRAAPGHALTRFVWNFGDGGGNVDGSSLNRHSYTTAGAYIVALTVFDDAGQQTIVTHPVTVSGGSIPPGGLPTVQFTFTPVTPHVGVPVNFDGTASRAATGRYLTTFTWDFGDGSPKVTGPPSQQQLTQHTYTSARPFTVILTVTDDANVNGVGVIVVTVVP